MSTRVAEPSKQSPFEAARSRRTPANGWWGMLLVVASEGTLLTTLVASYFYLRFKSVHWPPPGIPKPDLVVPIVLAAVLVATTVPMLLAVAAVRRGNLRATRLWLALALVVGSGYFARQVHRFVDSLHRFTPQDHAYGSIYYTLLGAHHGHVLVALVLNVWLLLKLRNGITNYRLIAVEAIALYWVFVNVTVIGVTATILSAA